VKSRSWCKDRGGRQGRGLRGGRQGRGLREEHQTFSEAGVETYRIHS
jgi:hypothetical protein